MIERLACFEFIITNYVFQERTLRIVATKYLHIYCMLAKCLHTFFCLNGLNVDLFTDQYAHRRRCLRRYISREHPGGGRSRAPRTRLNVEFLSAVLVN